MYRITKIVTNDGEEFNNERNARHHIECKYDGAIANLACLIRGTQNVLQLKLIIDSNISILEELVNLKKELENGIEEGE